jgi:hypothetical protein
MLGLILVLLALGGWAVKGVKSRATARLRVCSAGSFDEYGRLLSRSSDQRANAAGAALRRLLGLAGRADRVRPPRKEESMLTVSRATAEVNGCVEAVTETRHGAQALRP